MFIQVIIALIVVALFVFLYMTVKKYRQKKAIQGLRILVCIDKLNNDHKLSIDNGSCYSNIHVQNSDLSRCIVAELNFLGANAIKPPEEDEKIHDIKHEEANPFSGLEADFKIVGYLEEFTKSVPLKYLRGNEVTVRRFISVDIFGSLYPSFEMKRLDSYDKEYGVFGQGYDSYHYTNREARIIIRKLARLARVYRRQSKKSKNVV